MERTIAQRVAVDIRLLRLPFMPLGKNDFYFVVVEYGVSPIPAATNEAKYAPA